MKAPEQFRSPHQIEAEIKAASKLPEFDDFPIIEECWNENQIMWRMDNGKGYTYVVSQPNYQYHLMFFDERLVLVEYRGKTIFSNISQRMTTLLTNPAPRDPMLDIPCPKVSMEELYELFGV
jgi:hypothetical protein